MSNKEIKEFLNFMLTFTSILAILGLLIILGIVLYNIVIWSWYNLLFGLSMLEQVVTYLAL